METRDTCRRHRDGLPSPEPRRSQPRDRHRRRASSACAQCALTGSMNMPASRDPSAIPPSSPARRRFVQGLALAGAAGTGLLRTPALAMTSPLLAGRDFDLSIGPTILDITGRPRPAVAVNGSVPAPLLRWREGDTVTVRVSNRLADAPSSIHWHGILLPANMDGVPGMSFDGIAPGDTWLYRFTLRQSGTYWYHSHSLFQEQAGLYGPIVVDPLQPPPYHYDREHVLLLSDWTDLAPDALFRRLKKAPSYDNLYKRTAADFLRDARRDGLRATLADRGMWGRMARTPTDLSDVNGNTYTYLLNGQPPAANWTGLFRPGEKVLLRLINAGAMTYFDVRIPGLKMTVVAADGQYVHPVTVDELRIAAAETYDVIVEPSGQDAYTIFAQDMGRTGFARGTLAVRHGLAAPVPYVDPRPLLTTADMGYGDHPGHAPPRLRPRQPALAASPGSAGAVRRSAPAADRGRHGPRRPRRACRCRTCRAWHAAHRECTGARRPWRSGPARGPRCAWRTR